MPGIIVGVDGSSHSQQALQWALSEAAARHAPLTVLSVRDEKAVTYTAGDLTQDQAAEEVQALVDQAVNSQSGPAPPVTIQVIPGSPATELLDAGHDADLLVVGSRGSGGLGRRGAGSVSSQVAYDAPCPVVIIFRPLAAGQAGMRGAARFPRAGPQGIAAYLSLQQGNGTRPGPRWNSARRRGRLMSQTARYQETLRRLAMIDEGFVEDEARLGLDLDRTSTLEPKTAALLQLGVLVASGSPAVCLQWSTARALAAGATEDDIADVLLAIAPVTGLGRVVCAAPDIATALGYDLVAALEEPDDP